LKTLLPSVGNFTIVPENFKIDIEKWGIDFCFYSQNSFYKKDSKSGYKKEGTFDSLDQIF
jgi:hypothetical protein